MSSQSEASQLRRRTSATTLSTAHDGHAADLTQSLSQLSLSGSGPPKSPGLPKLSTALKPPSRRSSPSPTTRGHSRSPSKGRRSRTSSPRAPLLRKASTNSLRSVNGANHVPARRASSTNIASPASRTSSFSFATSEEERPPLTASSVARSQFQAELDIHHGPVATLQPSAVVILNDAVYGHRFSRPRTSRGALSTIVERPERIRASVLGVSTAYVRLGERYTGGSHPLHPKRNLHALDSIPFRIHKTTRALSLMSQAVTNVHGTKWMEELKIMCQQAESKMALGGKELQRPEMARGPDHPGPERLHEGDLYLCSESLDAMEGALGAVCEAVDTVFGAGPRRAFVGVRPPGHHCSASYPSGFCWVNNVHVGIMHAALSHGLTHAAIIDFDLHHGDGSQDITWKHNSRFATGTKNTPAWKRTSIGYFSIHDINSYPCEMGDEEKVKNASLCIDNAHGQTIWNVHLQSWKTEQDFWELYESKYLVILEKTRDYLKTQAQRLKAANLAPKAAIFFSAGFDASEWESAGMQRHQVNVPTEFYARLTRDVVKLAAEDGLFVDGRVISVLEGGYSDRALCSGVFSHLSGLVGDQPRAEIKQEANGLAYEMGQKMGVIPDEKAVEPDHLPSSCTHQNYDPSWWSSAELDRLEGEAMKPLAPPKQPRKSTPQTYSSPTQSSTARTLEPVKIRRSLSGLATAAKAARPPSPPPPEVSWMTAAHELSKLLIPEHRSTESCTAEELNAEASRIRRDRQYAMMGLPPVPPVPASVQTPERPTSKMALRERRAKPSAIAEEDTTDNERRRTGATPGPSPEKNVPPSNRRRSRRLSATSGMTTPRSDSPPPLPVGINSVDRPTAAWPRRPETTASYRTQSADKLPVKKTRTPVAQRSTPRAPRGTKKTVGGTKLAPDTPGPATATGSGAASDASASDVDRITSGMKKIKINLITQSQREAREKARLEPNSTADAQSTGQPTPTPSSATEEPSFSPQIITPGYADSMNASPADMRPPSSHLLAPSESSSGVPTPVQEQSSVDGISPTSRQDEGDTMYQPAQQSSISSGVDASTFFIAYQPEGPEPEALPREDALTWLPPNIATPSANTPAATPNPIKKHNNLFHYTSGIPFAPRQQNTSASVDASQTKGVATENEPNTKPHNMTWGASKLPQRSE